MKLFLIFLVSLLLIGNQGKTQTEAFNPAAVGGNISMPSELYNDLKAKYGDALVENGLKIELWSVSYYRKADNANEKTINFNQKVNASFNYSSEVSGGKTIIKYTFRGNVPTEEGLAVLLYFGDLPPKYTEISAKKTLPQLETGSIIRYSSNAKQKAGIVNKNWSMYCLGKYTIAGTDEVNGNFEVVGFTAGTMRTMGLWDDIVDTAGDVVEGAFGIVKDAVGIAFEGGKKLAGVIITAGGANVIQVGSIFFNFIVHGNLPKFRTMSQEEYDWANRKIFNNTLPSRSSILITNLVGQGDRAFTIPNGLGQIYLNIGAAAYNNPMAFMRNGEVAGQLFIHELTHAWQIEHNSLLKSAAEGPVNQYKYTILGDKSIYQYTCGKAWNDFNFEQQASLTDACFNRNERDIRNFCERDYVVRNIRNNLQFPYQNPAPIGKIHALSRFDKNMEVITIRADGSIWTNYWYEGANPSWNSGQIAPPNSANANSKIAVTSRHAKTMEIFWTTPDGRVMDAYWYDGQQGWKTFELAPKGSAIVEGGGITAISRKPNTLEIFWVGPGGKIMDGYWYEGQQGWKTFELAPAGSVSSFGNNITCLSRAGNTIELFWIGSAGKIMDAFWYEGQQGWRIFELAPFGSANVFSGITAVSRATGTMELFWIASDGSIKDAYWYEGQKNWQIFELAKPGSAMVGKNIYASTGITAVARKSSTMDLFWIGPEGQVRDAYWYEGQQGWRTFDIAPAGSAEIDTGIKVIARANNTMELWWQSPGGILEDAYWYEGQNGWRRFRLYPVKP